MKRVPLVEGTLFFVQKFHHGDTEVMELHGGYSVFLCVLRVSVVKK